MYTFTGDAARMADSTAMMSICDPVHLVLVKTEPSGETTLISSHFLEWRPVLAAADSRCNLTIEVMGVGKGNTNLKTILIYELTGTAIPH